MPSSSPRSAISATQPRWLRQIDDQQEKDALHGNQPKRRRNRDPGADRQCDAEGAEKICNSIDERSGN